jgi:hypothetical protein
MNCVLWYVGLIVLAVSTLLCGPAARATLVTSSNGEPIDLFIHSSTMSQHFPGFTTYFFTVIVQPNATNNSINAIDAEFDHATSMRQNGSVIFQSPMSVDLTDSQFEFNPAAIGAAPDNGMGERETIEGSTFLAGEFTFFSEPLITAASPRQIAHVLIPDNTAGTANLEFVYIRGNPLDPLDRHTATFVNVPFDFSVGTSAIPEAGIVFFWSGASLTAAAVALWRKLRARHMCCT